MTANSPTQSSREHQIAQWVFSEAQRLSEEIQKRTQRATFNAITGFIFIVVPAAVAFTTSLDRKFYLLAPILLSAVPLTMLEEDKETLAIGARLAILEKMVNDYARTTVLRSELTAERGRILPTRYALYGMFVGIWIAIWAIAFYIIVDEHLDWGVTVAYGVVCGLILLTAVISATRRTEIADRTAEVPPTTEG